MLQDEKNSKSVCEVRIIEVSACVWPDFVTTPVKLRRLQDTGRRNRSVSLHPSSKCSYFFLYCGIESLCFQVNSRQIGLYNKACFEKFSIDIDFCERRKITSMY